MKFRMQGNVIELAKWTVTYEMDESEQTEIACSDEEKSAIVSRLEALDITPSVTAVEQPEYDWLNGMEVADLDEAWRLAELGQEAYLVEVNAPSETDYLVELDYRLSKMELGV